MFVVVEGLTGAGKSTATRLLVEEFNFELVDLRPDEFLPALRLVEDSSDLLEARHALYLALAFNCGAEVEKLLDSGHMVVVDSWVYRTMATHVALGSRLRCEIPDWLPIPDATLLIELGDSERSKRILERQRPSGYWKAQCERVSGEIMEWYRLHAANLRIIDNSLGAHELRTQVASVVKDLLSD